MNIKYNKALWLIIILAIVMMTQFLGLTDFNSKGETRDVLPWYCNQGVRGMESASRWLE